MDHVIYDGDDKTRKIEWEAFQVCVCNENTCMEDV